MIVNKISIKNLVEYRRMSNRRKSGFIKNLKVPARSSGSGGGNYWVRSLSAISTAFKQNDNSIITDRLELVESALSLTSITKTRGMYQRNIDILRNYVNYDFNAMRPDSEVVFLAKPKTKSLMQMNGVTVQVRPSHVFTYECDGAKRIGATWFITWLDGYKVTDLGIYADALHRYLTEHYSEEFVVDPKFCMVTDVSEMKTVNFDQVISGEIKSLLDEVLIEIKEMSS